MAFNRFLVLILICTSCCKIINDPCDNPRHFQIPIEVSSIKDTFALGDTIQIQIIVDQDLYDTNNNEFVDIRDWNYTTEISTFQINGDSLLFANHLFNFDENLIVQILDPEVHGVYCVFQEDPEKRVFNGKMVLKTGGKFIFSISHVRLELILPKPECQFKIVDLSYVLNETSANNYYLIESEEIRKEFTEDEMYKFGGFVFVVE